MIVLSEHLQLDGIQHGFFTRRDGTSTGIYASLNCGPGSNDNPDAIHKNRGAVLANFPTCKSLLSLYQIHSPTVITVTAPWPDGGQPKADGMVTRKPGIVLGILTADCAPVLLADENAGVIGAAHAGWKGALGGVVQNVVDAMVTLGAKRQDIVATVGPCIAQKSYEVGPDLYNVFMDQTPAHAIFFKSSERAGHYLFDLEGFVVHRLQQTGITRANAFHRDTYAEPDNFFSYRRTTHQGEPDYGRQISAIALT